MKKKCCDSNEANFWSEKMFDFEKVAEVERWAADSYDQ